MKIFDFQSQSPVGLQPDEAVVLKGAEAHGSRTLEVRHSFVRKPAAGVEKMENSLSRKIFDLQSQSPMGRQSDEAVVLKGAKAPGSRTFLVRHLD